MIPANVRVERTAIGTLQTDVAALQAGGSSNLVVQSTTGSASIKIESNTDIAGGHSSLSLFSNSANSAEDRHWKMNTDHGNSDALVLTCESTSFGTKEAFRFGPGGTVAFAAGGNPITSTIQAFRTPGSATLCECRTTSTSTLVQPFAGRTRMGTICSQAPRAARPHSSEAGMGRPTH